MATGSQKPPEHPQKPWVGRVLTEWWPTLRDAVGSDRLMPRSAPKRNPRRKRVQLREYGCGYYGCVFPTGNSGLVFKVTTDSSEAAFVAAARAIESWPRGMVLYTHVYQLAGEKHGRRPVYVLWREAASNVGELLGLYKDGIPQRYLDRYGERDLEDFIAALLFYRDAATGILNIVRSSKQPRQLLRQVQRQEEWAYDVFLNDIHEAARVLHCSRGAKKIALSIIACSIAADAAADTVSGRQIGEALLFYLDAGMALADVHLGNLGEGFRGREQHLVITDPGHMVPLEPSLLKVEVPLLEKVR